MTAMNAETKLALGRRWRSSAAVCASTSAGRSESHVRASTKKRTIELSAATSSPLPATSPMRTAAAPLGRVHAPNTSPPPTSGPAAAPDVVAGRLVPQADLQARQRRRGPGHEAAREGGRDPPLALEVERVRD